MEDYNGVILFRLIGSSRGCIVVTLLEVFGLGLERLGLFLVDRNREKRFVGFSGLFVRVKFFLGGVRVLGTREVEFLRKKWY